MHTTSKVLTSLTLIASLTNGLAGGAAIGVAMASGPFQINNAEVRGNASLFDGSEVRTVRASSKLRLQGGARVELSTNSMAKIFASRTVLEQGAGQIEGPASYSMEARTLQVRPSAHAIARVELQANAVLISAVNGPVKVNNSAGRLVTSIAPGASFFFHPQATDGFDVSGCVLQKNGKFILIEGTTSQMYELKGGELAPLLGNRAQIKGKTGEGKTIETATQVIQVDSATLVAPGGCLAVQANSGADPLPGGATVKGGSGKKAAAAAGAAGGAAAGAAAAGAAGGAAAGAAAGISTGVLVGVGVAAAGGTAAAVALASSKSTKSP
jgi:hypothetical protein